MKLLGKSLTSNSTATTSSYSKKYSDGGGTGGGNKKPPVSHVNKKIMNSLSYGNKAFKTNTYGKMVSSGAHPLRKGVNRLEDRWLCILFVVVVLFMGWMFS